MEPNLWPAKRRCASTSPAARPWFARPTIRSARRFRCAISTKTIHERRDQVARADALERRGRVRSEVDGHYARRSLVRAVDGAHVQGAWGVRAGEHEPPRLLRVAGGGAEVGQRPRQ